MHLCIYFWTFMQSQIQWYFYVFYESPQKGMISVILIIFISIIVIAYLYGKYITSNYDKEQIERHIIRSWKTIVRKSDDGFSKVTLR